MMDWLQTLPDNLLVGLAIAWLVCGLLLNGWKMSPVRWPVALTALTLFAALGLRSLQAGYWALTNMYESVVSLVLGLALVWLMTMGQPTALKPIRVGGIALMLGLLGFGLTLPQSIEPIMPALASIWRAIHVPVVMLSYSLFALSFVASVVVLAQAARYPKEAVNALSPPSSISLPLDVSERCIRLGFALLAIGIILGALWANESWGVYWNWDPKETMALATLLGYGVFLHLQYSDKRNPVLLSWVSVAAFGVLLLTYFGVNVLGVGLHSYGSF